MWNVWVPAFMKLSQDGALRFISPIGTVTNSRSGHGERSTGSICISSQWMAATPLLYVEPLPSYSTWRLKDFGLQVELVCWICNNESRQRLKRWRCHLCVCGAGCTLPELIGRRPLTQRNINILTGRSRLQLGQISSIFVFVQLVTQSVRHLYPVM